MVGCGTYCIPAAADNYIVDYHIMQEKEVSTPMYSYSIDVNSRFLSLILFPATVNIDIIFFNGYSFY